MAIHKTKRTFVLIFFSLLVSLSLISCNKKKEEVIEFNETHPLSLAPDVEWALITDPYAAYRKDIEWNAEVTNHCRRGDILQVYAKSIDKQKTVWYKFEEGWLPETCLSIYSNRYKAQTAAENLKD